MSLQGPLVLTSDICGGKANAVAVPSPVMTPAAQASQVLLFAEDVCEVLDSKDPRPAGNSIHTSASRRCVNSVTSVYRAVRALV